MGPGRRQIDGAVRNEENLRAKEAPAVDTLSAGARIGPYVFVRRLGRGGMATTWLAREEPSGREVVLKFPDLYQLGDPAMYERFRREVEIGRTVDHPGVAKAIELRDDGLQPYVVMEYVSGRLLADLLSDGGPLPWAEAVDLCSQLLDALEYLHNRGICHRDLKPENLIVTPDGRVRIIDFGLAMLDGHPRVTWRGFSSLAGTPAYLSPEQIRGERGGPGSDIYAAGVILFEMLAGHPPFQGDNPLVVMHQALNDPLPALPHPGDAPEGLANVVARALQRDRSTRYPTAAAFRADLRHPETVAAPPPQPARPGGGRSGRLGARLRHSVWVPWLGAGLVVLAVLIALATLHMGR